MKAACLMFIAAIAVIGALAPGYAAAGGGAANLQWKLQHSGVSVRLNDISCAKPTACMAVGDNGTIVRTADGGSTWRSIHNPFSNTTRSLTSIRCGTVRHCDVVAPSNTVLWTGDGGKTWHEHVIHLAKTLGSLGPIACPTADECFVTASPSGLTDTWFTHSGGMFKTTDGGRTWNSSPIPGSVPCPGDCNNRPVGYELQWISCVSALHCRAGGNTFIGSHEGSASAFIATDDGGTVWRLVHHSFDPTVASCGALKTCVGVRYQPLTPSVGPDFMRTTTEGAHWTVDQGVNYQGVKPIMTSVACLGQVFCELAGPSGALVMSIRDRRFRQKSPTGRDLNAVSCPARRACFAVGNRGTIVAKT